MSLALIAALPFLGALLPGLLIRWGRNACALAAGSATALALAILLSHAPAVLRGEVVTTQVDWLPQLGLNANFMLDGLGLMFAGLILGIGLLIILYARFYLAERDPMGLFYTYLLLFQGAMTGIVLSDNILLLLVFWELTSLSSFLLIGYWRHLPEGRQGARMALTVTGAGGLAMIGGMLILGQIAGSYDLSVILTKGDEIRASDWYLPALVLILLGCFTKSAQFPFHFWLPQAMAAPTPVSAYLHSATMVKAGIFLMARLWPVLAGSDAWFVIVTTAGLATMVLGAMVALWKDDLKALLAYSTVSHLGLVTMLLGFGTPEAAVAAVFHILNHATFKCALFMAAGIVDHEAHTRSIARLGGLRRLMPVTFGIVAVASLSMAGFPPLNGFLSKEMMLEEAVHATLLAWWLVPALATLGALFSVAYSLRLIAHVFLGPVREDYPHRPHDPGFGMWAAPAALAVLVVVIGVVPMTAAGWLVQVAAGAVTGGEAVVKIYHWHGFVPALFLSVAAIGGGFVLLGLYAPLSGMGLRGPQAKVLFEGLVEGAVSAARRVTQGLHDGSMTRALTVAVLAIGAAGVWAFLGGVHGPGLRAAMPVPPVVAVAWVLLVVATLSLAFVHGDRILALVIVAVIGLVISIGFAFLSAPDLALTQISVEVVTVVLMLLALNFLPRTSPVEGSGARRLWDAGVAGAAGLGIGALAWAMMRRDPGFPAIAEYHLANAKPGGGGTNAVNVIIVDFRGYDTFGEIIVLGTAALILFALTEALLRSAPAMERLAAMRLTEGDAGDPHPLMMVVATRFLLPVAAMVAVFLFLRGHNLPGGGFVAGLVVAIAVVMQYMASGLRWTERRQRVDHHVLIGAGVVIAAATGIGAWVNGLPFLTSAYGYFTFWPLETFELATAALFDLGVFLTVLGAVMLALSSLSRLAVRSGEAEVSQPQGISPSKGR